ncbi:MAG: hypothetical protein AVDCRST_MAG11-3889, partial [uncultured Gemmatimonadaceae bacterium]
EGFARVAGLSEVQAGLAPPAQRLRARRRPDHVQGLGLQQPGLRVQHPHRQRRGELRPPRGTVAAV